jgi:hypothetical protein
MVVQVAAALDINCVHLLIHPLNAPQVDQHRQMKPINVEAHVLTAETTTITQRRALEVDIRRGGGTELLAATALDPRPREFSVATMAQKITGETKLRMQGGGSPGGQTLGELWLVTPDSTTRTPETRGTSPDLIHGHHHRGNHVRRVPHTLGPPVVPGSP